MDSMKQSRKCSFLLILIVYLLASAVGIAVFAACAGQDDLLRLFAGDAAATVAVFLGSLLLRNASVYDPYWSVAPVVMLTSLAVYYGAFDAPSLLVLLGVWVWGVRLTANWAYTFENLMVQDWRYDKYQAQSKLFWPVVNFFGIHFMPTLIVFLAMVPAFRLMTLHAGANGWTFLAFGLMIFAAGLQYFSDRQAHAFRRQHPGGVCDRGLWRYSRHPNYLGEVLLWWGVYGALLSVSPGEWITGLGALANTLLFVFISIPLMEKRQLARKPAYAAYRRRTSALLLWPPRNA